MSSDLPDPEPLDVAEGYGLSELGENHLSLDQVIERFATERSWWIATTRPDGRPHVVPVWGVGLGGQLVFSSDPNATKGRNLANNSAVTVHLESGDQVAIIEGHAIKVTGDELPDGFTPTYNEKYGFEVDTADPAFGFYRIDPTKVFSWDEGDFAATAARWRYPR